MISFKKNIQIYLNKDIKISSKSSSEETKLREQNIEEFKRNIDIKNLIFERFRFYITFPPRYIDDSKKTKLINDFNYFDSVVDYIMKSKTFYDLHHSDA